MNVYRNMDYKWLGQNLTCLTSLTGLTGLTACYIQPCNAQQHAMLLLQPVYGVHSPAYPDEQLHNTRVALGTGNVQWCAVVWGIVDSVNVLLSTVRECAHRLDNIPIFDCFQ